MNNSLRNLAASVAFASILATVPVYALTPSETATLEKQVAAARIVEVPAVASQLVGKALAKERINTAVAVVVAGIKTHPTSLASVISSVLKVAPEATEAVVEAAIETAPDQAVAVVRAASEAAPAKTDSVLLAASRKAPSKATVFEREVSQVRARRLESNAPVAAALTSTGSTTTPVVGPDAEITPITTGTYSGGDVLRP